MRWQSTKAFIQHWAQSVRLTIASVEFKHARNRQRAKDVPSWHVFAANFVLNEYGPLLDEEASEHGQAGTEHAASSELVERHDLNKKRHRQSTPFQCFASKYCRRERDKGRKGMNYIRHPVVRQECEQKFRELTDDERRLYEEEAASTLSAADAKLLMNSVVAPRHPGSPPELALAIPTQVHKACLAACHPGVTLVSPDGRKIPGSNMDTKRGIGDLVTYQDSPCFPIASAILWLFFPTHVFPLWWGPRT